MSMIKYPRDLVGYADKAPDPRWPGGARLAVNFVLNYEEGGERSVLHGDACSETRLADLFAAAPVQGARDLNIESAYEYGSRVGFWRLMRIFTERQVPLTIYAVGMALERNPYAAEAMARQGCEIVDHGWRWLDYRDIDEATEREHVRLSVESIRSLVGVRPVGWLRRVRPVPTLDGSSWRKVASSMTATPTMTSCHTGRHEHQPTASHYSALARRQRYPSRARSWLGTSRGFLHLAARQFRCALQRGGVGTQVDDRRGPLPPRRQAGSRCRFRTVHRSCPLP